MTSIAPGAIDFDLRIKKCTKCGEMLSFESFYKSSKAKSGLASSCKFCSRKKLGINSSFVPSSKSFFIDLERKIKECSSCGLILPFSNFYTRSKTKLGMSLKCIDCYYKDKGRPRKKRKRSNCKIDYENELKECSKCFKMLSFNSFHKTTGNRVGLHSMCKECVLEEGKKERNSNRPKCLVDYEKELKECSLCRKMLSFDSFYKYGRSKSGLSPRCKICVSISNGYKSVRSSKCKIDYENELKECSMCKEMLPFVKFNKASGNNKLGISAKCSMCTRKHFHSRINSKIAKNFRERVRLACKNNAKAGSILDYLRCSIEFFKKYLEERFYDHPETGEKMTWDNYGKEYYNGCKSWNIDHILPLVSFDLTDENQLKAAVSYTNTQPLWEEHNLSKSDSLEWSLVGGKNVSSSGNE